MFGAILKATICSFQKGMPFCRSVYEKKVMKLLAFIFEQPSYEHLNSIIFNANISILSQIRQLFFWIFEKFEFRNLSRKFDIINYVTS